jgi:hypothetical protein
MQSRNGVDLLRLLILAVAMTFPCLASAQSAMDDALGSCRPVKETEQKMRDAVGSGPDAADRAVKFYSDLLGTPQYENRLPIGVELSWTLPYKAGAARPHEEGKSFTRHVMVTIMGFAGASCTITLPKS